MQLFDDCICIAQARVIGGYKREPHICTIAYQPSADRFLRICIPFLQGRSPVIKRWRVFSFEGTKDHLANDTREESWNLVRVLQTSQQTIGDKLKRDLHCRILSNYRYECELNDQRDSIGLLVPIPDTLKFTREHLSARRPEEAKELERVQMLHEKGIWYPNFKVKVRGCYMRDGQRCTFNKQLIAWDVYEALRLGGNRDPFAAIDTYRNPYLIIGNLAAQRKAWVVVGVLSAPDGAIQRHAIHQQLALV